MILGSLGLEDVERALALSTAEGWNQSTRDWTRMVALEPGGCFAMRDGERLVGTVTTTTYGRDLAWIGMMIVDPAYRRRGIGADLMGRALDHLHGLGIATVKLDATPAGLPLYRSLGFVEQTVMERWHGVAPARPTSAAVRPAGGADDLHRLDRAAYGVDRSRLVDRLVADGVGAPRVAHTNGAAAGYVLARRGRTASYLGPIVAADRATALALLDAMLTGLAGEEVSLDRHRDGPIDGAALEERGLTRRRDLVRMVHGPATAAATSPLVCASSGPEFG